MAKTADAKAKVYSKYGRELYVCAKAGGSDPDGNLALRGLIDRAKKNQVPAHVIEKAIDKNSIPGAVVLVAKNNQIIYKKAFGIKNPKQKILIK